MARQATRRMETFPNANRIYLLASKRQKISPCNPRGTGYSDVGMAYPGVAKRKTPEGEKTAHYLLVKIYLSTLIVGLQP